MITYGEQLSLIKPCVSNSHLSLYLLYHATLSIVISFLLLKSYLLAYVL